MMSEDDPFKKLSTNLNKPIEAPTTPKTPKDLYDRTTAALPAFFDAINKFDDIVQRHGGRVGFTFTRADIPNWMTYGELVISAGGNSLARMSVSFQGKALWIEHRDFVAFARRQVENGSWTVDELPDLIKYLGAYIEQVMRPA